MVKEKVILDERQPLGKLFETLVLDEMPINKWCMQRDRLNKNKKF